MTKTLWVLLDNRRGSVGQAMGVVNLLSDEFKVIEKKVDYTKLSALPNWLRGRTLIGLTDESKKLISAPFPDFVLSISRRTAPIARYIKKKSPQTKLIQLMHPGNAGLSEFDLVIVDSIQTLAMDEISSAPGTVSQVTNCGNLIIRAAKATDTAVIIVGHVTKEGTLAGPKVLEHLVDVVLNFEGDRYGGFKTVRAVKNRFGSTNEVAIFEMGQDGLKEVQNPSAALLAERTNTDGSVILATMEGNRPILVEIQALATTSNYGYPKRTASGFDINRLNLLIAVLERRTKLKLSDKDIFINVGVAVIYLVLMCRLSKIETG